MALDATALEAGGLFMRFYPPNKASFRNVTLNNANITGEIFMNGASVGGPLNANFVHIDGNLDLRGAILAGLDLSGASIAGDLRLGGPYESPPWKGKNGEPGALTLRNAHIGNLMD